MLDTEKYFLSFGVSYVEIPVLILILLFQQSCPSSPVSILKPIFHRKLGSHWVPNTNEIYTKKKKYTWPTQAFCVGTQHNLYSTDWRRGLASGLTQILGLASGNANFHILDTNMLGDAEVLFFALGDAKVPDATYFAFWWNIGYKVRKIAE